MNASNIPSADPPNYDSATWENLVNEINHLISAVLDENGELGGAWRLGAKLLLDEPDEWEEEKERTLIMK